MPYNPGLPPFFERYGWSQQDWQQCIRWIEHQYPDHRIDDRISQGGCSYTIKLNPRLAAKGDDRSLLDDDKPFMLQFRPQAFALSPSTASAAKDWYPAFAPSVDQVHRFFGLPRGGNEMIMYRTSYIPGERLSDMLSHGPFLSSAFKRKYQALLDDLAAFYARAWIKSRQHTSSRLRCTGRVGSSLLLRLRHLGIELPSQALRCTAQCARRAVEAGTLTHLPVVYTHGDFLPSNILVDPQTWRINGIIDWAESEMLPFGLSLYGIEHLLGYLDSGAQEGKKRFVYFEQAEELRRYFFRRLEEHIPELRRSEVKEALQLARVAGMLLWHGFAWDDGRIDRVVDIDRDGEEAAYLEAFLGTAREAAGPKALL